MWKTSKGYRLILSVATICGIIQICVGFAFVWLCKELVDIATGKADGSSYRMTIFCILMVTCIIVQALLSGLNSYITTTAEAKMKNSLQYILFDKVMGCRWTGVEKFHTGDAINRIEEDVRVVCSTLCSSVPNMICNIAQAVGAFIYLFILSPVLSIMIAGILPAALILAKLLGRKLKHMTKNIRDTDSRIQALMQESLQKRLLLLCLLHTDNCIKTLKHMQKELLELVIRRNKFTVRSRFLITLGFGIGYATTFIWSVFQIKNGEVTFGMMTAFLQLIGLLQRPVAEFSRLVPGFINAIASVERIKEFEVLEKENCKYIDSAIYEMNNKNLCGVRLKNLTFKYPDGNRDIIQDISYDFKPGTITAIIGPTGSGKSSLIKLILGVLSPNSGHVYIYDSHGHEFEASVSTRSEILYVPQGNSIMSGTVRSNLLKGNINVGNITDENIRKALYTSAAEFVYDLPKGINTICGENGIGLSEGQAQRISIARALLCKGNIILLDEFSSALDEKTEKIILERLQKNIEGKTIITVTHRQEVSSICNNILSLTS